MSNDNALSYLLDHGVSLEEVQKNMAAGISTEQQAQAVKNMVERGEWERPQDKERPCLVRASQIPYEPPRWTLAPYFQRGKGTLIQGDN